MHFTPNVLYHVYNRGNNRQQIFFSKENYLYFKDKIVAELNPYCDLIAYCLIPNHFHLIIHANEKTVEVPERNKISKSAFSDGVRILLSSYTRAINRQEKRFGSLFTQNTQSKALMNWSENKWYAEYCFYYAHRNPYANKLVQNLNDWPYSSYPEYASKKVEPICNHEIARQYLDIDWENFVAFSHGYVNEKLYKNHIF
jgi:putative transposase